MDSIRVLKKIRRLKSPNKEIVWHLTKYHLHLTLTINIELYEQIGIKLPPETLGRCTEWRNVVSLDKLTSVYNASWDLKRVAWDMLDSVTMELGKVAMSVVSSDDTHST